MKIQLPFLFSFLICLFQSHLIIAQNNNNGNGKGENGSGTKYKIEGNQLPCVGSIQTYTIVPNPKTKLNTWEWEWDEPRAHAGDPPKGWEIISYSLDYAQVTVRVGEKPGTIKLKPDPGSSNTINLPVHPSQPLKLSISGPTLICIGKEQVFRVKIENLDNGKKNDKKAEIEDFTFTWEMPAGLTLINNAVNASTIKVKCDDTFKGGVINVKVSLPGYKDESAISGNGVGVVTGFCNKEANFSLPVNIDPNCENNIINCSPLQVAITGPVTVCASQNELVTYTVNVPGNPAELTYTWALPVGWEIATQQNNQVQVRIGSVDGLVTAESVFISVQVKNICNQKVTDQQQVFINEQCKGNTPYINVPILLPVELISFSGKENKSGIILEWATANEINNDHFEIERSNSAALFVKIAEMKGHGNSLSKHTYSVQDTKKGKGTYYYRLKQVDEDGTFTYSKVIAVNSKQFVSTMALQVAPNPVTNSQFTIFLVGGETTQLQILSLNSHLVHSQIINSDIRELNLNANQLHLQSGVYLLSVKSVYGLYTTKLIIP